MNIKFLTKFNQLSNVHSLHWQYGTSFELLVKIHAFVEYDNEKETNITERKDNMYFI